MSLRSLPTLAQVQAQRAGKPILKPGLPKPLEKKARLKSKEAQGKAFRDQVWARDQGRSRATGKKLLRAGSTDWGKIGEVDHSILRSLAPERIYDPSNGLLLSKEENRLRKVVCARAPEFKVFDYSGPENRGLPQHFVWRNQDGKITKERIG